MCRHSKKLAFGANFRFVHIHRYMLHLQWVHYLSSSETQSLLNWSLKFPSWPCSSPFTCLSRCCFFPLWWVQVKKKSLPSSPTPLLLAQNRMIKASVSHLRNCNNATVPSKGKVPHCEMTGCWYESVVYFPGEIRGGLVDVYCCVALNDLTSVVEERCHGGQTCCLCQFFLGFGILEKLSVFPFTCIWLFDYQTVL